MAGTGGEASSWLPPVLTGSHVTASSGSGVVHAPKHDAEKLGVCVRRGQERIRGLSRLTAGRQAAVSAPTAASLARVENGAVRAEWCPVDDAHHFAVAASTSLEGLDAMTGGGSHVVDLLTASLSAVLSASLSVTDTRRTGGRSSR